MRLNPRLMLIALGTVLALWLILGFWMLKPLNSVVLCALTLLVAAALLWMQWRKPAEAPAVTDVVLPAEDFAGAVVLVCGDSAPLFAAETHRETREGWYLPVSSPEQLPLLAALFAEQRPALLPQLSVLMAVVPELHASTEQFAQQQRAWQRALLQCRRPLNGLPPVWTVTWASHAGSATAWFCALPDRPGLQACESGNGSLPLADWFAQAAEPVHRALWLQNLLMWSAQQVAFDSPLTPCRRGFCLTPVSAQPGNLWQQFTAQLTTLTPGANATPAALPLPEMLLAGLPHRQGISRRMRYVRYAGLLCGTFFALALLASFVNNQRLIRSLGDHLALWAHLPGEPAAPKSLARDQLIVDRALLDGWQRSGEPLRLGLGLYQGMRLLAHVEAAINRWSPPPPPPPPAPIIKKIVQGPKTVRLDSLSLFDSGRSELKSGSDKVLINALVGIKAKPGWLIVVSGHTDNTGNPPLNQRLSLKRADAVRDWMRDTGDVPESCFAVQGYGESRPIASNDTPEGRMANRRVEISLIPQAGACSVPDTSPPSSLDGDGNHHEME